MTEPRFYSDEDLRALDKDALATIADARGLEVTGTGADGNVLVEDLIAAIRCHQDRTGINPALEPEPDPPRPARTYKVVGPHAVYGTQPGKRFRRRLSAEQEAQLIGAGHIAISKEKA